MTLNQRLRPLTLLLILFFRPLLSQPPQELEPVDWARLSDQVDLQVRDLKERLLQSRNGFQRSLMAEGEQQVAVRVVDRILMGAGFKVKEVGSGLYATLVGEKAGPTVALRFNLDLPGSEDVTGLRQFRSGESDVQLALAGTLGILFSRLESRLPGSIRIIIEAEAASLTGARPLLEAGVLDAQPALEAVFCLRVAPLPVGTIGIHAGQATAAGETFEIELPSGTGSGEIASALEKLASPTTLAETQNFFQEHVPRAGQGVARVVYRWWDESGRSVVPFFRGRILASDLAALKPARERLRQLLQPFPSSVYRSRPPVPPLSNHPELVQQALSFLHEQLPSVPVAELQTPIPYLVDDASLFQDRTRLLLIWLGMADQDSGVQERPPSRFSRSQEAALLTALSVLAKLPLHYMAERVNAVVAAGNPGPEAGNPKLESRKPARSGKF